MEKIFRLAFPENFQYNGPRKHSRAAARGGSAIKIYIFEWSAAARLITRLARDCVRHSAS